MSFLKEPGPTQINASKSWILFWPGSPLHPFWLEAPGGRHRRISVILASHVTRTWPNFGWCCWQRWQILMAIQHQKTSFETCDPRPTSLLSEEEIERRWQLTMSRMNALPTPWLMLDPMTDIMTDFMAIVVADDDILELGPAAKCYSEELFCLVSAVIIMVKHKNSETLQTPAVQV